MDTQLVDSVVVSFLIVCVVKFITHSLSVVGYSSPELFILDLFSNGVIIMLPIGIIANVSVQISSTLVVLIDVQYLLDIFVTNLWRFCTLFLLICIRYSY